jgi:hypothetical protein
MITDTIKHMFGMKSMEPGLKMLRRPGKDGLKQCQEFGRKIAGKITQEVGR